MPTGRGAMESNVPRQLPGLLKKLFNAQIPDPLVELDPAGMQVLVETGFFAGKIGTLVVEVDIFLLVAGAHTAVSEKFALFVAASVAILRGEVIQHLFEARIFLEDRIPQQCFEAFGINVEIAQVLSEFQAVPAYVTVHMGKTLGSIQPAGGRGSKDMVRCHEFLLILVVLRIRTGSLRRFSALKWRRNRAMPGSSDAWRT